MIAYRVFILEKYDSRSKVWNYFFISYEWIKFFVLYFEAIILDDSYIVYPKEKSAKIIDQFSRIILLLM